MDGNKYIVTRRFSLDGQIVDYLTDWSARDGTVCSMAPGRAIAFRDEGSAMAAVRICRRLVPNWEQSAAERAAGVPAKPICYGVARLDGDRVVPLLDVVDQAELEAAAH